MSPSRLKNSPKENIAALSEWPRRLSQLSFQSAPSLYCDFKCLPNNEFAVLIIYRVKTVVIAQKKHLHVRRVDQKDAPSSREKSTPPIGDPKAAATPVNRGLT